MTTSITATARNNLSSSDHKYRQHEQKDLVNITKNREQVNQIPQASKQINKFINKKKKQRT